VKHKKWLPYFCFLTAFFLEGIVGYLYWRQIVFVHWTDWIAPFCLHGAAVLVVLAGFGWMTDLFNRQRLWGRNLAFFVFFLPVVGCLIGFVIWLTYQIQGHQKREEEAEGETDVGLSPFPWLVSSDHAAVLEALDFEPLVDLLQGDNIDLKRGAIERLEQERSREAVAQLDALRKDHDMEVRFYATTSLTRIKKDFDSELSAIQERVKKNPKDVVAQLDWAEVFIRYATILPFNQEMRESFFQEIIGIFERVLKLSPKNVRAREGLMTIYELKKDWKMAIEEADCLKSLEPENFRWVKKRTEFHYALGQWHDMKKDMRLGMAFRTREDQFFSQARWWLDE